MTEDQERRQTEKIRAAGYSPAFPLFIPEGHYGTGSEASYGLTLRDWFAALSLANAYTRNEQDPSKAALWAYQVADAMLAAREAAQ